MISFRSPSRVGLATGLCDRRKGFGAMALMAQDVLRHDPHDGSLFVFRGRSGSLIKIIWNDGQGACLFIKRLERGRFIWAPEAGGAVTITGPQLSYLLSDIDWRMPQETWRPKVAG